MTITYAAERRGVPAHHYLCTDDDPACSNSAAVVVLYGGQWFGDALCADHAPTTALRSLAATEPARGCTPPAATEGLGDARPPAAPAPGGSTSGGAA